MRNATISNESTPHPERKIIGIVPGSSAIIGAKIAPIFALILQILYAVTEILLWNRVGMEKYIDAYVAPAKNFQKNIIIGTIATSELNMI